MDLLITVSNNKSVTLLTPLLHATTRHACHCELFLTHTGVELLNDQNLVNTIKDSNITAIACHDSWIRYADGKDCQITLGSQTNHSEMIARARQVISL